MQLLVLPDVWHARWESCWLTNVDLCAGRELSLVLWVLFVLRSRVSISPLPCTCKGEVEPRHTEVAHFSTAAGSSMRRQGAGAHARAEFDQLPLRSFPFQVNAC